MGKKIVLSDDLHSEDLQEIVTKAPSWLLQRGISFVLITVLLIIGLSVFIKYPEVVNTTLKFNTTNAPKVLVNRVNGYLTKILVRDGDWVEENTDIAFIESTANHMHVLDLLTSIKETRTAYQGDIVLTNIVSPNLLDLGELQGSYQNFYLAYLSYQSVSADGIYHKRKRLLLDEMSNFSEQERRIRESYTLQKKQLELTETDYGRYQALAERKLVSPAELQAKESLLLAKHQAILQMENVIIANQGSVLSKRKELSEIENQIVEEEKKFLQALNSFVSEAENWKKQYVLTAHSEGKLIFSSFLQESQYVAAGQEIFYINPNNEEFFGEAFIPQGSSSKVKQGQDVLIKVRSYPYQEFGILRGKVDYISDIPIQDSVFFSRIMLERSVQDSLIKLKPGILADAEIITTDQSIFKRIWSNINKSFKI